MMGKWRWSSLQEYRKMNEGMGKDDLEGCGRLCFCLRAALRPGGTQAGGDLVAQDQELVGGNTFYGRLHECVDFLVV